MATYSDPDRLDELTLRAGADIRSPLLRTLVDLYLQKPAHTAEETQHFTELTLRLLDQADADTRAAVMHRLADYPSVPPAVMHRLAGPPDNATPVEPADGGAAAAVEADHHAPEHDPTLELAELFFSAGSNERHLILTNLAYAPTAAAIVTGDTREAARQLESAALAHNPDAFVRGLDRWLGITPALARRIVNDPLGEPIVVAAKVLDMTPDAVQRILLFLNPAVGRSVSRVYELATLFSTIDIQAANVLVGIWRSTDPPTAAHAVPHASAERDERRVALHRSGKVQREAAGVTPRTASGMRSA